MVKWTTGYPRLWIASRATLGAEDAYAILWSDLVALRRNLTNYLIATVVSPLLYICSLRLWSGREHQDGRH